MEAARNHPWTADEFLAWATTQEGRWEFDGFRPVAMTGGTANHNRITSNIHAALRSRLRGTPCSYFGSDLGVQTISSRIRYPDALITCTKFPGTSLLAPDPIVIFEVLSPNTGATDRIEKLREYQAVPSILRYIIVESATIGLLALYRTSPGESWTTQALIKGDTLQIPETGIEIPVQDLYEDVSFEEALPNL